MSELQKIRIKLKAYDHALLDSSAAKIVETARKTLDYAHTLAVEFSHETVPPHPVHEWSALYTGMAKTRLYGGAIGWKALPVRGWAQGYPRRSPGRQHPSEIGRAHV